MLRNILWLVGVVFFASACSLAQAVPPTPQPVTDLPTAVVVVPSQTFDVLTSTPPPTVEMTAEPKPPTSIS